MDLKSITFICILVYVLLLSVPGHGQPIEYKKNLATAEARARAPHYFQLFDWQPIEIIKEGIIHEDLASLVRTDGWHPEVSMDKLLWLHLHSLDINKEGFSDSEDNEMTIPFEVSLRYQETETETETGNLIENLVEDVDKLITEGTRQGTLIASGNIYPFSDGEEKVRVEVVAFGDSSEGERMGRELGAINQYDGAFVAGVVEPLLEEYFNSNDGEQREALLNLVP